MYGSFGSSCYFKITGNNTGSIYEYTTTCAGQNYTGSVSSRSIDGNDYIDIAIQSDTANSGGFSKAGSFTNCVIS